MKVKKLTSFFIVAIALLLSACGQAPDKSAEQFSTQAEVPTEETPAEIGENTLVWRVRLPLGANEGDQFDNVADIWQDSLNTLLAEKGADYTVEIKPLGITEGFREDMINTTDELEALKAADEPTDIISIRSSDVNGELEGYELMYPNCAERGLLLPLEPLLEGERGNAIKEAVTQVDLDRCRTNGHIYGLFAVLPPTGYTAYSAEQMKKYNITEDELMVPIFENEALMQKIRDLSGEAPYGILSGDCQHELGLWLINPTEAVAFGRDGVFVNVTETPEFRERLAKLADWKEKGLVQVLSGIREDMCFAQNDAGQNFSDQPYYADANLTIGFGKEKRCSVFVVPEPDMCSIAPYWGDTRQCIASWTKKQDLAEDFLVRLMTDPDIANLIQYGREGQEYTLNDGKAEISSNISGYLRLFGDQYTNTLITESTAMMAEDKQEYAKRFHETYEKEIPNGFQFDPASVREQVIATNRVFQEGNSEAAGKIRKLQFDDVDQVIAELTADLKAAGIDAVVEEANRQLAQWRADYEK